MTPKIVVKQDSNTLFNIFNRVSGMQKLVIYLSTIFTCHVNATNIFNFVKFKCGCVFPNCLFPLFAKLTKGNQLDGKTNKW